MLLPCMDTHLRPTEFNISRGLLTTIYSPQQFTSTEYKNLSTNDSVLLCFPFNKDFLSCFKWQQQLQEFNLSEDRNLTSKITNFTYKFGDYNITPEDEIFVCIPYKLPVNPLTIDKLFLLIWILSIVCLKSMFCLLIFRSKPYQTCTSMNLHMITLFSMYVVCIIGLLTPSHYANCQFILLIFTCYTATSTGCWLNVYAFEAWRRLHPNRILIYPAPKSTKLSIFLQLSYGWGLPLFIVALFTIFGHFSVSNFNGKFFNDIAHILYVCIEVAILSANIVLFVITVSNLHKIGLDVTIANTTIAKKLIRVYFKLMIIVVLISASGCAVYFIPCQDSSFVIFQGFIAIQGTWLFVTLGFSTVHKQ